MKPFNFSLEKLLAVRSIKEKQEMVALSTLNGKKMQILGFLDKLKEQKANQEKILSSLEPDSPKSFHEQRSYYHLEYLIQSEQRRIAEKLKNINKEITGQQKVIIEKSQEKKVVERLKEKAFDDYRLETRREENKINDDNNQNIWQWKTRGLIES